MANYFKKLADTPADTRGARRITLDLSPADAGKLQDLVAAAGGDSTAAVLRAAVREKWARDHRTKNEDDGGAV